MPRDPVSDFFASAPRRSVPRERTVAEELEGTIFTDPVKDFFVREGLHRPKPRSVAFVDDAVENIFQAPKFLTDWARENAESLSTPELDDSPFTARMKGFGAGAHEAAAGLMSPFNIATAAAPVGRVPGALGALLRAVEGGGNAFQVGMSAHQTKDAIEAGDTEGAALGAGMTALGALGAGSSLRGGPRPGRIPEPREVFENGNFRRPPLGPEHFPVEDVFEPNPSMQGDRSTVRPWWEPDAPPPVADPVAELFASADGRLPARAGGPFAPPPGRGSIAAVPPPIPEASRWQQPAGAPEPPVAPPTADPLADVLSQPPARRAAPAKPQPAAGVDPARAQLERDGFPPDLIEAFLSQPGTPVDPVTGRRPIAMPQARPPRPVPPPEPPPAAAPEPPPPAGSTSHGPTNEYFNGVKQDMTFAGGDPQFAAGRARGRAMRAWAEKQQPPAPPAVADLPARVEMPSPSQPALPAVDPQRPAVPVPAAGADPIWDRTLAAARAQGFEGSDDELLALFNDRRRSAQDLIDDLRAGAEEFSPTALTKFIRAHGGLKSFNKADNRRYYGDLASIVEGFASPSTRNQRGGASVFRNDGQTIDDMLVAINNDGRWGQLDERSFVEMLDEISRSSTDEGFDIPTLESALRAAGVDEARPWWKDGGDDSFDVESLDPPADPLVDLLDTGEVQPRLPGDVGAVRTADIPTPEVADLPFALRRDVAPSGTADRAIQPPLAESSPGDVSLTSRSRTGGTAPTESFLDEIANLRRSAPASSGDVQARNASDPASTIPTDLSGPGSYNRDSSSGSPGKGTSDISSTAASANPSQVRSNVKDFLVRQLGYDPAEVDAMGPDAAMALGNQVRMHPPEEGGIKGGIAKYRKPTPPRPVGPPEAVPNLGEDSLRVPADELATLLGIQPRRQALMRQRVPAETVNEPVSGEIPDRSLADPVKRGEKLTVTERRDLGLPEEKPPADAPKSQSEIALAKSEMTRNAREMARLINDPTPENLKQYERLVMEQADRDWRRSEVGGTGKEPPKKNERTGEYLASGLGGFEALLKDNPAKFWWTMRTAGSGLVGALVGSERDEDDPVMGGLRGLGLGLAAGAGGAKLARALKRDAPGVFKAIKDTLPPKLGGAKGFDPLDRLIRRPHDPNVDIAPYGAGQQPFRAVPELWKRISPVLTDMKRYEDEFVAMAAREKWRGTPEEHRQHAHNQMVQEALGHIDNFAKEARARQDAQGRPLYNTAEYAEEMGNVLRHVPAAAEKLASAVTGGLITPKQAKEGFRVLENAIYANLFKVAFDTGIINRTQVLYAYPHTGMQALVAGIKKGRTAQGQFEAAAIPRSTPHPKSVAGRLIARIPNRKIKEIVELSDSPIAAGDNANARDAYLAVKESVKDSGLSEAEQHEFAMGVTTQTQGVRDLELGVNPFLRHLGPMAMLSKFPTVSVQYWTDVLGHPDPSVRRRAIGMLLGLKAVSAVTGISMTNFLFPSLMVVSGAPIAYKVIKDAAAHALNSSDHSFLEDIDPNRGGTVLTGRYPAKLFRELKHFYKEGFKEHSTTTRAGLPGPSHTASQGAFSLIGGRTVEQEEERGRVDDAYQWAADARRRRGIKTRLAKQDLAAGDTSAAKGLTPAQLREFRKNQQRDEMQRIRATVPPAERAEFDRRFGGEQ